MNIIRFMRPWHWEKLRMADKAYRAGAIGRLEWHKEVAEVVLEAYYDATDEDIIDSMRWGRGIPSFLKEE